MPPNGKQFEFPREIDQVLGAMSSTLRTKGAIGLQRLIVNATPSIQEGTTYDNWDGGTYGHTVKLTIPHELFAEVAASKEEWEAMMLTEMNRLMSASNERVDRVILVPAADGADANWREQTGLLLDSAPNKGKRPVPADRLWSSDTARIFISHKESQKRFAGELQKRLSLFGAKCFVAHVDIEPSREWQRDIELALRSMDAIVALLCPEFATSEWTYQEIGAAIGRRVPIVPVEMGGRPLGFLKKFQYLRAQNSDASDLASNIFDHLIKKPTLTKKMTEAVVRSFIQARSFDDANELMDKISSLAIVTQAQLKAMQRAVKRNRQLSGARRVNAAFELVAKRLEAALEDG